MYILSCFLFFALSTTEEASHSWGETFGDQNRHRLVCGKPLENHDPARITQKTIIGDDAQVLFNEEELIHKLSLRKQKMIQS